MKILRPKPVLTYPLIDRQTIFDYVFHHFIVEKNPKAALANGICVYDTPEGGCAIGCLLPADLRSKIGQTVFGISTLGSGEVNDRTRARYTFFGELFKAFGFEAGATSRHDAHLGFEAGATSRHDAHLGFLAALQCAHDSSNNSRGFHDDFSKGLEEVAKHNRLTLPVQY